MEKRRKSNALSLLFTIVLLVSSALSFSQDKLRITNGDLTVKNPDKQSESIWLYKNAKGQAKLIQKNTSIESDSTQYAEGRNYAEALGNVYINQADSIDIYSQKAFYYGNSRKAILKGEVALLKDIYSLQTEKLNYDLNRNVATYTTGGELNDTTSTLTSKKGTYYVDIDKAVFTDSVVLVSKNRKIETEKLTYLMNEKWAYFEGPTTIYEEGRILKTNKGKYNTETGEALLENNPEIDDEETYAKADQFTLTEKGGIGSATNVYYKDKLKNIELRAQQAEQLSDDEILVKGNVDVMDWENNVKLLADQAITNQTTNVTTATGNVDITQLTDSVNLKAGKVISNQKEETFFATNNVILTIMAQHTQLLADTLDAQQQQGIGRAYGRPFLSTMNESDSIFMIAKEFQALQIPTENQDTTYDFVANQNVMLYKSDLQAIADSAYVNSIDSVITLFKKPVIWSDSTQMSADTINIYLKNKKIEKVEFRQNCFFVNLVDTGLYNQLKGRIMDAYFNDGKIDSLHTDGNAETIFIVQDEQKAYVAIDEMKSGKMDVSFIDGKMDQVYWYKQQSGTTYPFQDTNPQDHKLQGFAWREDEKPQSKNDLLSAIDRIVGQFKIKAKEIEKNNKTKPEKRSKVALQKLE